MPLGLVNTPWPFCNESRAYPLAPHAAPTDTTGSFTLPDDLLVGLYIPVPAALSTNPAKYYISNITTYSAGMSLTVSYDGGPLGQIPVATVVAAFSSLTEFTPLLLNGVGVFNGSVGKIVFGKLDNLLLQPFGAFSFTSAATPLDVDCIRPQLQGVAGIQIVDGQGALHTLTGVVQVQMGQNINLSLYDSQTIRIDASEGAGLNESCSCSGDVTPPPPITSINGITADATGALVIAGDTCLHVNPVTNGFQITDTCSNPCCGCTELEALTAELQNFSTVATTLGNFTSRLQGTIDQVTQVVIGSKLSDTGCVTCS